MTESTQRPGEDDTPEEDKRAELEEGALERPSASGGSPDDPPVADATGEQAALEPIPEELVEIVRGVAGDDPEKVRTVLELVAWSWRGPLPPPSALAAYNHAYPECARDIVEMAKNQSNHRQAVETKVVDSDIENRRRGQLYGFIISMTVLLGGLGLMALGKSLVGFGSIVVALAGLVGLFVYTRWEGAKELHEKRLVPEDDRGPRAGGAPPGHRGGSEAPPAQPEQS